MTSPETPESRLAMLRIELPTVPSPIANFVPWRVTGDLVYLAGQICEWNGQVLYAGKVGSDQTLEAAQAAARICGLNLLAALRACCDGSLDRVTACIRLGGFVNCTPDFAYVPQVINGASDLMHEVFGRAAGAHARTAVGVASLPQRAAVEVDGVFQIAGPGDAVRG
jgi:enamine deaminase RidA (YjgF/YER057c/UK114 family)